MSHRRSARAIADVNGGIILGEVEVAATPERVFRALTDSNEIVQWMGSPDVFQTQSWTADLRVGGKWKTEGRNPDGSQYTVSGVFREVDPPRRLVQTWKPDWDSGPETTLTYELSPTDQGTRVTLRHDGFAGQPESCRMHADGWEAILGWLSQHLAASPAESRDKFYLIRLLPPRPSFAHDMTADEASVMFEHGAYWTERLRTGEAIVFGPVADPKGSWGLGVVRATGDEQIKTLEAHDPAILSGKGFRYEVLPMLQAVTGS